MFEIYKSYKGRKTYIVSRAEYRPTLAYAKRFFKCSENHIVCVIGYIYKSELYLEDPHKRGTKACWIAYYKG